MNKNPLTCAFTNCQPESITLFGLSLGGVRKLGGHTGPATIAASSDETEHESHSLQRDTRGGLWDRLPGIARRSRPRRLESGAADAHCAGTTTSVVADAFGLVLVIHHADRMRVVTLPT
jgi:hypothetical protein